MIHLDLYVFPFPQGKRVRERLWASWYFTVYHCDGTCVSEGASVYVYHPTCLCVFSSCKQHNETIKCSTNEPGAVSKAHACLKCDDTVHWDAHTQMQGSPEVDIPFWRKCKFIFFIFSFLLWNVMRICCVSRLQKVKRLVTVNITVGDDHHMTFSRTSTHLHGLEISQFLWKPRKWPRGQVKAETLCISALILSIWVFIRRIFCCWPQTLTALSEMFIRLHLHIWHVSGFQGGVKYLQKSIHPS